MKYVIIILFVLIILFLQIGIFPSLKILNAYPNIILLAIICLAILKGWRNCLGWIIAAGIFLDFYGLYNVMGISVLALLLTGLFAHFLNQKFLKKENNLSLGLIFLISSLFYELLLIAAFKAFGIGFNFAPISLAIKSLYSSVAALPVFYAIKWYVDKIKKIQS